MIQKTLNKESFNYSINGRSKSIYSIHNKMENQSIPFENIFDKFAIRIVYSAEIEEEKFIAWKIYSVITDHFVPNPTRLRDWITAPKSTGYEALHITVSGPENQWIEVQIRSERMHEIAEKGYAAHHKYKIKNKNDIGIEDWLDRLKELLKDNSVNAVDFVDDFKLSLYSEEIYVFTPNGDGENDIFAIEVAGQLNKCSDLKIYNRWGQIIFISTGGNTKWDGYTNVGQAVPEATYFFVIDINGVMKSGSVALFR